ncbi:hypothetical protein TNCV_1996341 [Trichonephila clavipes]|uniref:Tc1-like transposase DDE domain-containing protein n=1 Tax=Trichonephila clavipes TaxID=2585209 RepID=A0A8X6V6N1_TRICX|nr:hypothetical protein TNCV_1996341 [Trichonephila clavipes]
MEDNTQQHIAALIDYCLEDEYIPHVDWPARSSELNPILNIWDSLERAIVRHQPIHKILQVLKSLLLEE